MSGHGMTTETDPSSSHQVGDSSHLYSQSWFTMLEERGICKATIDRFRAEIIRFYRAEGRNFSWRCNLSPYRVLVSEIMLQQTQTGRVEDKFRTFIDRFSGFDQLASAEFSEVLRYWKGLGYNRRAKYLHDISQRIVAEYQSIMPDDPEVLEGFPGIGRATAASICVFAFDRPYPFIETNIRTVFIHFFFPGQAKVSDKKIMSLVEQTMDREHPRQWYYALMDYGVMLKKTVGNLSRKSSEYRKQSRFEGSDRQLRGRILDLLLDQGSIGSSSAANLLEQPEERVSSLLEKLSLEGLIVEEGGLYKLA